MDSGDLRAAARVRRGVGAAVATRAPHRRRARPRRGPRDRVRRVPRHVARHCPTTWLALLAGVVRRLLHVLWLLGTDRRRPRGDRGSPAAPVADRHGESAIAAMCALGDAARDSSLQPAWSDASTSYQTFLPQIAFLVATVVGTRSVSGPRIGSGTMSDDGAPGSRRRTSRRRDRRRRPPATPARRDGGARRGPAGRLQLPQVGARADRREPRPTPAGARRGRAWSSSTRSSRTVDRARGCR